MSSRQPRAVSWRVLARCSVVFCWLVVMVLGVVSELNWILDLQDPSHAARLGMRTRPPVHPDAGWKPRAWESLVLEETSPNAECASTPGWELSQFRGLLLGWGLKLLNPFFAC